MSEPPRISRPYMPGYGVVGPQEGTGLLPWSWAEERLQRAHDYWVASLWPHGRPHVMPVWGTWHDGSAWFSSSRRSRKARNLMSDPHCAVTTGDAREPVVLEGAAEVVSDSQGIESFLTVLNAKYGTDYTGEFMDPEVNACFRVRPVWAFGLAEDDFTGSPTRWTFQ